ncbi:uncharacterized protein N7498_001750 [Penicillium cinerascens]|uniref:Uncharacterized protein n=1 Tax=Penicillium cinerascens TaxID=70096 RepID=A0A9W9TA89_9EURO|nr:uncharacterized protein N7498_001750 [Penicillium cinerascens]KAJ5215343.1 hypothetical protein N7498_001750 [Penicillium cinerascens]
MERSMYTDHELRVTTERNRKYRGTARINLKQIFLHPSICRSLDPRNVDRLCEIFSKEGCRRLEVANHVTAVVSNDNLNAALQKAGVSAALLMSGTPDKYPLLPFSSGQVKCLHGQHRLKAGEEFLSECDQWWTVDLYLDGSHISHSLQATLIEEYCNEKIPTDGEIYRKIRQYQYEANAHFEKRWKARLSPNKLKRFNQLKSHDDVRAALNSLLALPALLDQGLKLCSVSRALAIGCDEELVNGLNDLYEYWASLVKYKRSKMLKFDTHSIQALQLLGPGVSNKDRKTAKGLVLGGEAFPRFTSAERASIWKKMKSRKRIIPSLHTFFYDVWYLESCANCLKRVVSLNQNQSTVKRAMRNAFSRPLCDKKGCLIQTSETKFRRDKSCETDRAEIAYRQIWLYAMRHYLELTKEPKNKDGVVKSCEKADQKVLYDMAILAHKVGFRSEQIANLLKQSPDRQIAREALLKARKPEQFQYNGFDSIVDRVAEYFNQASPLDCEPEEEFIDDRELQIKSRCGKPATKVQRQDRRFLFVDQLHSAWPSTINKVSSLFVRQCVYYKFFGELQPTLSGHGRDRDSISPLFVPREGPRPSDRFSEAEISRHQAYLEEGYQKKHNTAEKHRRRHRQEKQTERAQNRKHERRMNPLVRSRHEGLERPVSLTASESIYGAGDDSRSMDGSSIFAENEGSQFSSIERPQQTSELDLNDDTEMSSVAEISFQGRLDHESQHEDLRMSIDTLQEQPQPQDSPLVLATSAEQDHLEENSVNMSHQPEGDVAMSDALDGAGAGNIERIESGEDQIQYVTEHRRSVPHTGRYSGNSVQRSRSPYIRSQRDKEMRYNARRSRSPDNWAPRNYGLRSDARQNWSSYDRTQPRKQKDCSVLDDLQETLDQEIDNLSHQKEPPGQERQTRPVTQINFGETHVQPQDIQDYQDYGLKGREDRGGSERNLSPWDATLTTSAGIFDAGKGDSLGSQDSLLRRSHDAEQAAEPSTIQMPADGFLANQAYPAAEGRTSLSENLESVSSQIQAETLSQASGHVGHNSKRDGLIFPQSASEQQLVGAVPGSLPSIILATTEAAGARQSHSGPTDASKALPGGRPSERQGIEERPLRVISEHVDVPQQTSTVELETRDNPPTEPHAETYPPKNTSNELKRSFASRGYSKQYQQRPEGETKKPRAIKEMRKARAITRIDFEEWAGQTATSEQEPRESQGGVGTPHDSLAAVHYQNSAFVNDGGRNERQKAVYARLEQEPHAQADPRDEREDTSKIQIVFRGRDARGGFKEVHMMVDPSDPAPVISFSKDLARNYEATFYDQNLRQIAPGMCFEAAVQSDTNTVFVAIGRNFSASEENVKFVSRALGEGDGNEAYDDGIS